MVVELWSSQGVSMFSTQKQDNHSKEKEKERKSKKKTTIINSLFRQNC